jgi:hypothetical protein
MYHLLLTGTWLRDHNLDPVFGNIPNNYYGYVPANGSVWFWWWMAPSHSELYANLAFFPQAALLALAVGAVARELGARRAIVLPVSVAAHSPLMAEAAEGMREVIAGVRFRDPEIPLLANSDARPISTADEARNELVDHLTAGVDWVAAVERMAGAGVDTFIEVGPGRVLTGLIKRIAPDSEAFALDDPSATDGLAVPFATPATT